MQRILVALLLFAPLLRAGDAEKTVDRAYRFAKLMVRKQRKPYAAEQASHFDGVVSGTDTLYVAYLWLMAERWSEAASAFDAYLRTAGPKGRNRATAMLERARALIEAGRFKAVPRVVQDYVEEFPGGKYTGRMRFYEGRAARVRGRIEGALAAFRRATIAGHDLCPYEEVDCLIHLGRYKEAGRALRRIRYPSARADTAKRALGQLGRTLPRLPFDFWAGRSRRTRIIRGAVGRPAIYSFWSSKAIRANDLSQKAMNTWAKRYGKRIDAVGPAVYLQFDPYRMKTDPQMTRETERNWISSWHTEQDLRYPLVLLEDSTLHDLCGVDPKRPALPAFALVDRKGRLRYVRVGGSSWALEAVESMLRTLLDE